VPRLRGFCYHPFVGSSAKLGVCSVPLLLSFAQAAEPPTNAAEFFELQVRPVLAKNCFACHTQSKLGGLRVDSLPSLLKGGNSGPAIVPGKPEESLLIEAVRRTHERFKMPPQGKLPDSE